MFCGSHEISHLENCMVLVTDVKKNEFKLKQVQRGVVVVTREMENLYSERRQKSDVFSLAKSRLRRHMITVYKYIGWGDNWGERSYLS